MRKIELGLMSLNSFVFIPTFFISWNDWGYKLLFEFAFWDLHIDFFK